MSGLAEWPMLLAGAVLILMLAENVVAVVGTGLSIGRRADDSQ
jgi:hypothetical protein